MYGPGSSARAIDAGAAAQLGQALEEHLDVGGEERRRLRQSAALQRVQLLGRRRGVRRRAEPVDRVGREDHRLACAGCASAASFIGFPRRRAPTPARSCVIVTARYPAHREPSRHGVRLPVADLEDEKARLRCASRSARGSPRRRARAPARAAARAGARPACRHTAGSRRRDPSPPRRLEAALAQLDVEAEPERVLARERERVVPRRRRRRPPRRGARPSARARSRPSRRRCRARAATAMPSSSASARSTTISVSGRGTSARASVFKRQAAEAPLAEHVGERLALLAPGEQRLERAVDLAVEVGVDARCVSCRATCASSSSASTRGVSMPAAASRRSAVARASRAVKRRARGGGRRSSAPR